MEYYYINKEKISEDNKLITVDGFQYRHLAIVLRKKVGDIIEITDGNLNVYETKIVKITKTEIICEIINRKYNLFEPDISITLYISLLKNSERFEFAVEKCVELGVKSIVPVITERTVTKSGISKSKIDRIKRIIETAVGQSQRCFLPEFENSISFKELISRTEVKQNKIVLYEFSENSNGVFQYKFTNDLFIFIGPEGGFTDSEIEILKQNKWLDYSLGKRKLRAETAAIVAVYEFLNKHNYKN